MKKTLFIATLALGLAGCGGGQWAAGDKEYDDLVAKANTEIKLADQTGFSWRDTDEFMKDADKAMQAGNRGKAIELVKKATRQARLAQQQAKDNANARPVY